MSNDDDLAPSPSNKEEEGTRSMMKSLLRMIRSMTRKMVKSIRKMDWCSKRVIIIFIVTHTVMF